MALKQLSPNVWNVGDEAYASEGEQTYKVRVVGFRRDMVRIELPSGERRIRTHGSLRRG